MITTAQRLGVADFQALFDRCSNWGRWGADDQRGTLNLLTPEKVARAAATVREGHTVSCSLPLNTVPDVDNTSPALHFMTRAGDAIKSSPTGSVGDFLALAPHGFAHSHLDALCHFSWQERIYNDRPVGAVTSIGAMANDITIGAQGIVGRGVLIDVAQQRGLTWLEPGTPITAADIEAFERHAGVRIEEGDILLIRTGRWRRRAEQGAWNSREVLAGLHHDAAPLIKERGAALLGCDGISDVIPHAFDGVGLPIHILTLVAIGIQLLDNLDLEALSAACAERRRWEFLLAVAPLRLERGTASATNPIAVF